MAIDLSENQGRRVTQSECDAARAYVYQSAVCLHFGGSIRIVLGDFEPVRHRTRSVPHMSARAVIELAIDTAQSCDRLGKTVTQPRGEYEVSEQRECDSTESTSWAQ